MNQMPDLESGRFSTPPNRAPVLQQNIGSACVIFFLTDSTTTGFITLNRHPREKIRFDGLKVHWISESIRVANPS